MPVLMPLITACLLLSSCQPRSPGKKLEVREIAISDHSVGVNFSMQLEDERLNIIYPSVDALSLNLISAELVPEPLLPAVKETNYLDRISYSPDIDESFGRHVFLAA